MKGNQGLDALAALCDSKTDESAVPNGTASTNASNSDSPAAPGAAMQPKEAQQPNPVQPNFTQQPWQQVMAAGSAFGGGQVNAAAAQMAFLQAAALQGALPTGGAIDLASMNTMQQLAYLQYIQMAQAAALQAQMTQSVNGAQHGNKMPIGVDGQTTQPTLQPGKTLLSLV